MNLGLRTGLLIASILAFGFVLYTVIKRRLNLKYSIAWILWGLFILLLSIFPELFYRFSKFIGVELPINGVYLIMIGLLYALIFYVYIIISKHNEEIIKLTYKISALDKELKELKKQDENKTKRSTRKKKDE